MGYTPPYLNLTNPSAGVWRLDAPGTATGNILRIYANTIDSYPRIEITGNDQIYIYLPGPGGVNYVDSTGSGFLKVNWVTPDAQISTFTNYNLALLPNGTGKVKFGAYTATPATDSTGYISILDSAGNARKLMVQA